MRRIYLSPPDMTATERELLLAAFDAGWVAPAGPDLAGFEHELCERLGLAPGVALSSGSAALHLALQIVGVQPGDEVLVPTLTFAASANAVRYVGAEPVFVDAHPATWNVDPELVVAEIEDAVAAGRRIGAVVTVDLYGQCADHAPILEVCDRHDIPVIEDAAEAVGATFEGRSAGGLAPIGIFSFNGNKMLTTGGGGMLVADDPAVVDQARFLATQAREPVLHYEHRAVGYNYRMPNLCAAVGRGQTARLDAMLHRRREINERYRAALGELPGVGWAPIDDRGTPNHWLTVMVLGAGAATNRDGLIAALDAVDAESRPAWKPMHEQPVWAGARCRGGEVASGVFRRGVCLPSGSSMTDDELERVIAAATVALTP